ncbi:MAG: hypothetical protein HY785_02305 [Oscillatoriophycideae cyanobacterium NC_groundwater_1537_Pr4_S-0.65um_50_18]|nr:hypothetical protein [Oscillatoriophycideae cyanobacterium NC_groundwater_1537_Pr4_S-0.65um_50_18]
MTLSTSTRAFDLDLGDLGSLFNGIDLGGILDDLLGSSSIFGNLDLGNIFDSVFGSSNIFESIDLDDLFGSLGIDDLFGSTSLSDIFDSLGDFGLSSGLDLGSLVDDLSDLFGDLNLGNLFGGVDDDYYYIFSKAPTDDLISGLGSVSGLTGKGSGTLDPNSVSPQDVDLLDGFGSVINLLGESGDLRKLSVKHVLTGDTVSDTLKGLKGDNLLVGLRGNDFVKGNKAEDLINGGKGNDNIVGDSGDDILGGGDGNDTLNGGRGQDILLAGKGFNLCIGGSGKDVFVLDLKGKSTVEDFRRDDKMGLLGSLSFEDLKIAQDGRDTIVSFNNKTLAVLEGIDAGRITASSFTQFG